jgi:hypothetical protein
MISYFINYGVGIHIPTGPKVWKVPFGFQLIPAGIMAFGLLTVKESPRWLLLSAATKKPLKTLHTFAKTLPHHQPLFLK